MIYLICNAHIDPVWMWRWEEGAAEALATFRSAVELLKENPDLIFNHNESLLYEWIEEYDPQLFIAIQKLIKDGRWRIMGGWFLQPDLNIPKGEAIIRQILRGWQFFKNRFDKTTVVANNFDSFGHARGLVQILKKCGYKYYIICRPLKNEGIAYDFDSSDFIWKGYDGSEVIVHHSYDFYSSQPGKAGEKIAKWIEENQHQKNGLILWGVGNHGGGPSRKDIEDIRAIQNNGVEIKHSFPEEYFEAIPIEKLPTVNRGLNQIMEGCYTSQIRIKQMHRRLENELLMTEIMASHASSMGLALYEQNSIGEAWRDLLLAEFHDSLPGTAIQTVEDDNIRLLDHGLEITSRLQAKYFFSLLAGQKKTAPGTVSIFVYNPHPFKIKLPVACSFLLPIQNWKQEFTVPFVLQNGKKIPCQITKEESNFSMDWSKKVVFLAELPATITSRFDVNFEVVSKRPCPQYAVTGKNFVLKTADGIIVINRETGLVDSFNSGGIEYVKSGAFSFAVFDDSYNSWRGLFAANGAVQHPIGHFSLMTKERARKFAGIRGADIDPVSIIEDGMVQTVVEVLMEYEDSRLCLRYIINKQSGGFELDVIVFFGEKDKRLKLIIPVNLPNAEYIGQTMFGREKLDICSGESVSQYWTCAANDEYAFSILNNGIYGSDFTNGDVRLTLLRSAGYAARDFTLGEPFLEPMYSTRMEQGERRYHFIFNGEKREERLLKIDREAAILNMPPFVLSCCPAGTGEPLSRLIEISEQNVLLSCFKKAEDSANKYILRVYEAQGKDTLFNVDIPLFNIGIKDEIKAFEIKTYRVCAHGIEPAPMLT